MATEKNIILRVTEEQLEMLQGFYTACGWDFNPQNDQDNEADPQNDEAAENNAG